MPKQTLITQIKTEDRKEKLVISHIKESIEAKAEAIVEILMRADISIGEKEETKLRQNILEEHVRVIEDVLFSRKHAGSLDERACRLMDRLSDHLSDYPQDIDHFDNLLDAKLTQACFLGMFWDKQEW